MEWTPAHPNWQCRVSQWPRFWPSPTLPVSAANSTPQCTLSRLHLRRSSASLVARLLLAAQIAASSVLCLADTDRVQLRPVATSGMPVPGGGTFDRFHVEGQPAITPVNDRRQVAFFATLAHARASEGMFLGDANGIQVIALSGSAVPGGGKLAGFPEHPVPALNRVGAVAFSASIAEGKASEGVFVSNKHRLRVIALSGSASSGVPGGIFTEFQAPALNDSGEVAFLAGVRRGRDTLEAIYLHRAGKLRKIAAAGDPAPGGGSFSAFGAPALNNKREVAFAAVIDGGSVTGGIFVASAAETRMLVGAGTPEPYGGIFAQFSDRVSINSGGSVLFNAILKLGPVNHALFVVERGEVRPVVGVGRAGSADADFSALGLWPSLSDDGTVAFIAAAADSSGAVGLFLAESLQTKRRAVVGDTLPDGATLVSFLLYPAVTCSPRGTLAFAIQGAAAGGKSFEAIFIATPQRE